MRRKRKGEFSRLDAELKSVLRQFGRGQRGVHPEIWARWCEIVGEDLAQRVIPRILIAGTLTVAVANSSWMQQLTYLKPTLLDRFAEEVGPNVVKDIRLTLDYSITHHQGRSRTATRPPPETTAPLPLEIAKATDSVKDETLREAMERAARASLGRDS
ncbi:MAG: DUF721 domain-containing protein [Proteobacteria bacterium]|nr:DUF721 domain-containing protein [Pseudomonadota bacterium]